MNNVKNRAKLYCAYIVALIILLSLGTWQVKRLIWKNSIITKLDHRINENSITPDKIHDLNLTEYEYRNIKIKGHFLNQNEIHLYGGSRVYKGPPGYFIMTPFKTLNNEYVLINRGWVPKDKKNSIDRPETIIDGETEIEGSILRGEERKLFIPKNDPKKNLWLWIDLNTIRNYTKLPIADFFILQKEDMDKNKLPIGRNLSVNIMNNHLGYALTWYILAIILTIILYIYIKQKDEKKYD